MHAFLRNKQDRKKKYMEMLKRYASIAVMVTTVVMFTGCFTNEGSTEGDNFNNGVSGVDPYGINTGSIDGTYVPGDAPLEEVNFQQLNAEDVQFTPVYFGYNTFTIPATEMEKVNALAEFLISQPTFLLLITGHCDERGTIEYNVSLGEYRAQAIRDVLIQLGISSDRIQTISMGEEMPVDAGHDEAAWQQNRRGEFTFYSR